MIRIKTFSLLIVLFFSVAIQSQTKVIIETNKSDALIFVNDSLVSEGNAEVKLRVGEYEIKARSNLKDWNSEVFIDSIKISGDGHPIKKTFNFEEKVLVNSSPQDAYIYESDSLLGSTPAYIPAVFSNIELRKSMYSPKMISLNEVKSNIVKLDFTGEVNTWRFTESVWFKVLVGSAAALGATAAYFKIKADNRFDEYEVSRDPKLLDEIDRYDFYSGTALGALQINFGILIYYFLTE